MVHSLLDLKISAPSDTHHTHIVADSVYINVEVSKSRQDQHSLGKGNVL